MKKLIATLSIILFANIAIELRLRGRYDTRNAARFGLWA